MGGGGLIVIDVAQKRVLEAPSLVMWHMRSERLLGVPGCWWHGSREGGAAADVAHEMGAAAGNDGDVACHRAVDA